MKRNVWLAVVLGAVSAGAAFAQGLDTVQMRKLKKPVAVDGDLKEWKNAPQVVFEKAKNVRDLKPEFGAIAWDDANLYVAFRVHDTKVVNTNGLDRIGYGDALDFRFCPDDADRARAFRLLVAPASASGKPAMTLTRFDGGAGPALAAATEGEPSPVVWAVRTSPKNWSVEAAIPLSLVGVKPSVGGKLPFVMLGWDRDRADVDEWRTGSGWWRRVQTSSHKRKPADWPVAVFADEKAVGVKNVRDGLTFARHDPCNMFDAGADVSFALRSRFPKGSKGVLTATLRDAYGKTVREIRESFATDGADARLALGELPRGYYELEMTARAEAPNGAVLSAADKATFGVMEQPRYTLDAFMKADRRFGLKWWGGVSDHEETKRMIDALGLNWSRAIFREALEITTNTDIQCIVKVERFPKELYDEAKYGPLADWEKKFGRGGWSLKTIPKEAEYRQYLRDWLARIPKDQKVFEIWNEPWDKLNAEDFTVLCKWIVEAVREVRPDAILGPNLKGDMSKYGYDAAVIAAGGMKGMDMVCLHPYGECEDRENIRDYRKWISEKCGRDIAVYITEYGAHSTPAGPARRTEREQAATVVRQSLCLYAEDCKALVPHWVGQSERNPNYHEDWFGYVRKNLQAKPVLVAHANCARLIDGSEYAGDLWFGENVGASLFRRDGATVLALYRRGPAKTTEVRLPVTGTTLVDLFGGERKLTAADGVFALELSEEPLFLTGLPATLTGSKELRADRFPKPPKPPRTVRKAPRMAKRPTFDGNLDEWTGATELAMINMRVNGDDASGIARLAWDDDFLYFAVAMRDNEVLNARPRAKLYQQDSIELFTSTEPRDENAGYGPNDRQFLVSPVSAEGAPIFGVLADRSMGVLTDVPGGEIGVAKTGRGWTVELGIPWRALGGFKPAKGKRLAFEPRVNDADSTHERWKIDPIDGHPSPENPTAWSILELD